MLKRMVEWFAYRAEARRQAEFDRGFGWLMTQHYWYGFPEYYLSDICSDQFDDSPFHAGVKEALRILPMDDMSDVTQPPAPRKR